MEHVLALMLMSHVTQTLLKHGATNFRTKKDFGTPKYGARVTVCACLHRCCAKTTSQPGARWAFTVAFHPCEFCCKKRMIHK
eukprot:2825595-Amphidinium_carterae.1